MDTTLARLAEQLPELDRIEALPDHLWARAARVAGGRPELPLSQVAAGVTVVERMFGER